MRLPSSTLVPSSRTTKGTFRSTSFAAAREVELDVPLVVRLEGTNVEEGKRILAESGLPIVSANDLGDAARKIVAQVQEAA